MSDYSAGEIYSYKRGEVVQKLDDQTKTAFVEYDIEVTNFSIWSVELPDTLMHRLEKEFVTRFENAINNCSREMKGVVTKIRDDIIFYAFMIENKSYDGILNSEEGGKVSIGDSVSIEYACEDPFFHRVKK